MVFVSSLDLKEFRGIKELKEPLEFAKFNVLIGRNNSGIDVLLKILDTELEGKDCSLILLQKTADDILLHKRLTLEELEDFVISNQDPRLLPDLLKL
ncbi:MAG: hypothetical protein ISS94_01785 [Candidatus Syntrophoarchaeum sp.]|nr:hypothetical protein [Candidatus Syntrophoarchaeum sp.]